jgi:membrane protein implicated in regulation of membrane protease activity
MLLTPPHVTAAVRSPSFACLMSVLWSLLVIAGLLVLVYLMIAGVPRPHLSAGSPAPNTPRLFLPVLGAFSTSAGIVGYLTERSSYLTGPSRWATVGLSGLVAALLVTWLVVRVFATPSADPADDPRYHFQGHVARVSESILPDRLGRVVFEADGRHFELQAHSTDNTLLPVNTEVVIEEIDGEVATVERWTVVEQRL